MPPDGGLSQPFLPGGRRQGACAQNAEERAIKAPFGRRVSHTNLYSYSAGIVNFVLHALRACWPLVAKETVMDQQKTALILGATGGVGSEVAKALARRGWRIKGLRRSSRHGQANQQAGGQAQPS